MNSNTQVKKVKYENQDQNKRRGSLIKSKEKKRSNSNNSSGSNSSSRGNNTRQNENDVKERNLQANNISFNTSVNNNNKTNTTAATLTGAKQDESAYINNSKFTDNDYTINSSKRIILDSSVDQNQQQRLLSKLNGKQEITNQKKNSLIASPLITALTGPNDFENILNRSITNNEILPQIKNSYLQMSQKKNLNQRQLSNTSREKAMLNQKTQLSTQQSLYNMVNSYTVKDEEVIFRLRHQEEEQIMREKRQVELGNLLTGTISQKTNIKVGQAIKILEQAAEQHYTQLENKQKGDENGKFHMKRTTRSTSPKLRKLEPHQLQQIKTIKFLNSIKSKQPSQEFEKVEETKIYKYFNTEPKSPPIKANRLIVEQQANQNQQQPLTSKDQLTNKPQDPNRIINFNDDSLYYFKRMIIGKKGSTPNGIPSKENNPTRQIHSSPTRITSKREKINLLPPLTIKTNFTEEKEISEEPTDLEISKQQINTIQHLDIFN